MYAVTSIWLLSFTRATLRSAEFGFLGVVVYTRVHTPRRWGLPFSAGVLVLLVLAWRPFRTSCWIVGTGFLRSLRPPSHGRTVFVCLCVLGLPRWDCPAPAVGRVVRLTVPPRAVKRVAVLSLSRASSPSCHCPVDDADSGARTSCPGRPGHEDKDYPPQACRSKRGPPPVEGGLSR